MGSLQLGFSEKTNIQEIVDFLIKTILLMSRELGMSLTSTFGRISFEGKPSRNKKKPGSTLPQVLNSVQWTLWLSYLPQGHR